MKRQFPNAQIQYALGATYTAGTYALVSSAYLTPPDGKGSGLQIEYFDNPELQGQPKLRRNESRAYFDMGMEDAAVVAAIGNEKYSIRWTGTLTPPFTGEYDLTVRTGRWNRTATARLFLDATELVPGEPFPAQRTRRSGKTIVRLEAGRKYAVRVEYRQPGSGGTIQLGWIPPAGAALSEAERLVKDSDVAIVFVGLNSELEGEEMLGVNIPGFLGGDRTSLNLPEPQEELVKAAVNTGTPVAVVLTSGSAIAVNYAAERAAAVLAAWYGGEEAGTAIAETLAGANNPAGRLPVTFYKSEDQLPPFDDYDMKGRTYRYFKGSPLYAFGFGLSYSSFTYTGLSAKRTQTGAEIRATVKNASMRDGDEVVQLYIGGGPEKEAPIRSLRGFRRIHLRAGESREVTFTIGPDDLPKSAVEVSMGGGQPVAGIPHVRGTL
jgi:beta-glucosidase